MAHNTSSNKNRPMSIDAMLDMERKEVLALLESQSNNNTERVRSASPYDAPRSPVRSLLDIAEEPSSSSSTTRTAPGTQAPVRSMLDIDSPPSSPPPVFRSMLDVDGSPPSSGLATNSTVSRSKSDAGLKPVEFGPRMTGSSRAGGDPTSGYQFSRIYTANSGGQQLPKRTSQPGRQSFSAMAETLRGTDLSTLHFPGEGGRHSSGSNKFGNKSKSPHNRLSNRSRSPATFSPQLPPGKVMLGTGQIVDINNAYRRLSDANLAISSGSLAQLPMRKRSSEAGEGRLIKDYLGPDGEHLGSSDEDDDPFTSDDEDRGRNKAPRPISPDSATDATSENKNAQPYKSGRQTLSLLAAAEEERHHVAAQQPKYQYRSLIPEPEIKVTNSAGDTVKPSKTAVHPNTSYDQGPGSATPSVVDSDEEADVDDIKRAQKLSFSMTNILSAPDTHRAIRIIYRGDYTKIAQAAEEEHNRLRKYLVATDLSDESTHALEWAIGTVLRDGDTLIAIYCVDEDTGIATGDGLVPDDPKSMKEQAAALASVSSVSDFKRATAFALRGDSSTPGTPSGSPAPTGRGERSKGDEERRRAVKDITDRVLKLLRKTRLQVRVVVEVLHCKNPKHLITEVIDLINPTLVVIGSRGRSALKGVILGSFSNYLVTKSSVPVMVARKRLRKQSKYKRTAVRQVNNLSNPTARSLAMAKVD
ncbi:hypothetical protein HJFPF1_08931 [Paramyrothecium foliicola]|nr:hypothetical protein HJFPF1_08931 [Paramyrothecium foliicola]